MDEWDEFLAKADQPVDAEMKNSVMEIEAPVAETTDEGVLAQPQTPAANLQDFQDNAEILMQVAGGESLNTLLSPNGLWIKSPGPVEAAKPNNLSLHHSKKRLLKNHDGPSVPIANSLQDLSRAVVGHPILSHPLSLLKQHHSSLKPSHPLYEIDSFGIFFYGTVADVKIESNVNDDMMKAIPLKRNLVNSPLINSPLSYQCDYNYKCDDFKFIVSHDNLKILANSLPPSGKSAWVIPLAVKDGRVDLIAKGANSDQLYLLYEYLTLSVRSRIQDLLEPTIHVVSLASSEGVQIAVTTVSPALNISIGFRGAWHPEPSAQATDFLFSRQSNYSVEVDFEDGPLRCTAIKSFVPKLDTQNRLFLLLKALAAKLPALPDGNYFLAHPANTPIIKILGDSPVKSNQDAINLDIFIK